MCYKLLTWSKNALNYKYTSQSSVFILKMLCFMFKSQLRIIRFLRQHSFLHFDIMHFLQFRHYYSHPIRLVRFSNSYIHSIIDRFHSMFLGVVRYHRNGSSQLLLQNIDRSRRRTRRSTRNDGGDGDGLASFCQRRNQRTWFRDSWRRSAVSQSRWQLNSFHITNQFGYIFISLSI